MTGGPATELHPVEYRSRAFTAVIRNNHILMVRHIHDGRDYWTLPGGAVEPGETPLMAAQRELFEETGIAGEKFRQLFVHGTETCFLAMCDDSQTAVVGYDPELSDDQQVIQGIAWFRLDEKRDDLQVSKVLASLDDLD